MADRVFLHIGAPKSGSTFVQSLLWKHRAALRQNGLLVPGRSLFDHTLASIAVRTSTPSSRLQHRAAATWERLRGRIQKWPGPVVLSSEWLCWADADRVDRTLAELSPTPVHLIFTARAIAHQVPAAWQETLKLGSGETIDRFVERLNEPGARWSWSTIDPAESLVRWARSVPADRVHVVTLPPRGSEPGLLWERMCQVLDVDAAAYDADTPHTNESLGVESATLLQRVGPQLREAILDDDAGWIDQYRWLRDYLGHGLLVPRPGPRIAFPDALVTVLAARARDSAGVLRAHGYDVVGSLDDLLLCDQPAGGRSPDQVTDAEVLDVALPLVVELFGEVRRQTLRAESAHRLAGAGPAAPAPDTPAASDAPPTPPPGVFS